jgi:hypothetical protein
MRVKIRMIIKYLDNVKDCNGCRLYINCRCQYDGTEAKFSTIKSEKKTFEQHFLNKLPCLIRPCPIEVKNE